MASVTIEVTDVEANAVARAIGYTMANRAELEVGELLALAAYLGKAGAAWRAEVDRVSSVRGE